MADSKATIELPLLYTVWIPSTQFLVKIAKHCPRSTLNRKRFTLAVQLTNTAKLSSTLKSHASVTGQKYLLGVEFHNEILEIICLGSVNKEDHSSAINTSNLTNPQPCICYWSKIWKQRNIFLHSRRNQFARLVVRGMLYPGNTCIIVFYGTPTKVSTPPSSQNILRLIHQTRILHPHFKKRVPFYTSG